jgi:hypothetical protein
VAEAPSMEASKGAAVEVSAAKASAVEAPKGAAVEAVSVRTSEGIGMVEASAAGHSERLAPADRASVKLVPASAEGSFTGLGEAAALVVPGHTRTAEMSFRGDLKGRVLAGC